MTPEGRVKDGVKRYLKALGAYYFMPVQNGMGSRSLDFLVCYQGRWIAIETKAGAKGMTPKQNLTAKEMQAAGGITILVNESDTIPAQLNPWFFPTGGFS